MKMRLFWYRVRYAYWMRRETLMPYRMAWSAAMAVEYEWILDGYSPRDAVGEELSQWMY